jgi:transcriptional regulator with PAS, ATPase and Fis domain
LEEALKQKKELLINNAQSYIDYLNSQTIYSDSLEKIVAAGEESIENCKEYDEYQLLRSKFNEAKNYVQSLPLINEVTIPSDLLTPQEIENEEDNNNESSQNNSNESSQNEEDNSSSSQVVIPSMAADDGN